MKYILSLLLFSIAKLTFAQTILPDFLQGIWKVENQEIYEHWDKLNENTLKGFSYKIIDGQMIIKEYLDISKRKSKIIYTATVLNQNDGKGIEFKLIQADSLFIFENQKHDFPKKIIYKKLSNTEVFVQISDGKQKEFTYKLQKQTQQADTTVSNPNYDKELAAKLGADDYGMKSYFLIILKSGTNITADKELIQSSFRGHLDNISRLVDEGKIVVAGPLGKNEEKYRGIFILNNMANEDEAKELLKTDPAIKNGLLDYEIYSWYGSAALSEYLHFSDKIWKLKP